MRRVALPGAALLALLALGGCYTSPTRMITALSASSGLNPNRDGQPSPTVVRVYELKSVDVFNQLTFFDLFDKDTAKLGGDLLNRRELEVRPGKEQELDGEADPGAKFLGVIAGFRTVVGVPWRASIPLTQEGKNRITIRLDPQALTVVREPSRFLWIF